MDLRKCFSNSFGTQTSLATEYTDTQRLFVIIGYLVQLRGYVQSAKGSTARPGKSLFHGCAIMKILTVYFAVYAKNGHAHQ